MISDAAIDHMVKTALAVGFGPRVDYPYLGMSPISVGDWKGSSIAACVFYNAENAQEYLDKCLQELVGLGSEVKTDLLTVDTFDSGSVFYIATIVAGDLVTHEWFAQ